MSQQHQQQHRPLRAFSPAAQQHRPLRAFSPAAVEKAEDWDTDDSEIAQLSPLLRGHASPPDSMYAEFAKAHVKDAGPSTAPSRGLWKQWFSGGTPGLGSTLRFAVTYMALPFVTGVMAGMGEIFANELMYRWGWRGARPIMVSGRKGRVFPVAIEKPAAEAITKE
ncbi:hypothetical protein GGF46_004976 [Coemansia sp. RSA 552]|nr:hypothetical protein GGF46_004976 [Coemansia sp. RSA 552]